MAYRLVHLPQIGEVMLAKRRGARSLRLSVTPRGQVRVTIPYWTPYAVGINFAVSRRDWIIRQLEDHHQGPILAGARIGKLHRIVFVPDRSAWPPQVRTESNIIRVRSARPITEPEAQAKLAKACEKALRAEAQQLLVPRLQVLAKQHGFSYKNLRVRKLISRWGSCSADKSISLSYYLVQLPWELIDYVILHELVHTKHLHHGADFWQEFERVLPGAKKLRRQMRGFHPRPQPY